MRCKSTDFFLISQIICCNFADMKKKDHPVCRTYLRRHGRWPVCDPRPSVAPQQPPLAFRTDPGPGGRGGPRRYHQAQQQVLNQPSLPPPRWADERDGLFATFVLVG